MPIEAMVDLTGGLAERYELSKMQENLYDYIRQSFSANAFITCSRKGDWRQAHASDVNGLVQGHAYTITGIYRIYVDNVLCYLVRIRNPWGDNNEWKGKKGFFSYMTTYLLFSDTSVQKKIRSIHWNFNLKS